MRFTKMHGIGNDYVYIDAISQHIQDAYDLPQLANILSDRHTGIGGDGLVLILPSANADFNMRMFNADGSEAQMCGNAIRCVGKFVYDRRYTNKKNITVDTLAGVKTLQLFTDSDDQVYSVTVDMGEPVLETKLIPVRWDASPIVNLPITLNDVTYHITCVSMGNPHAVIFDNDLDTLIINQIGPIIENLNLFPERTNVEFVQVINKNHARMRVWERGSGETQACGTGACAVVVAGVLNQLLDRQTTVSLLGGDLQIHWNEDDNHVLMTGDAVTVFDGTINHEILRDTFIGDSSLRSE